MIDQQQIKSDLLTKTLTFDHATKSLLLMDEFDIFPLVKEGKINKINDYFQQLQMKEEYEEIKTLVNKKDIQGKSVLQYAWNLVLYLLTKGANPYEYDNEQRNLFHTAFFHGRYQCVSIIINQERHAIRMDLSNMIKITMRDYSFKKSDINKGILVCPEKHIVEVQQRFKEFQNQIYDLYEQYTIVCYNKFKQAISQLDHLNRNPIHYGAMSKFTTCFQTVKYLMSCDLYVSGYEDYRKIFDELQFIELNKEKRIDTRQYLHLINYDVVIYNFLTFEQITKINENFYKKVKIVQKEVVNQQDNEGLTPLHLSSFYGDFVFIQFLLKLGANPKIVCSKLKKTALEYSQNKLVRAALIDLKDAAKKGDEKSFLLLLNCGNKIDDKKTIFGIAPIHNAVSFANRTKESKFLQNVLKCGANLDNVDSNGWSSLHHACKLGNNDIAKSLLENHSDPFKFSNNKYYPIHVAALYNKHEIINILMKLYQDDRKYTMLEAKTYNNETPLHLASKKGNVEAMQELLKNGANIYATDIWKQTSLHIATFNNQKEAVNLLCNFDADYDKLLNMKNCKGKKASELVNSKELNFAFHTLWNAAKNGNLDIIRRLTILGKNINEQTRILKLTPLHFACMNGNFLIAKFLIENNANTEIKDSNNYPPLYYAKYNQYLNIVELFKEKDQIQ